MLRVTVLELPASWGDPLRVLASVDAALERGPETDLVLLPEASLTGYVSPDGDYDLTRFAEPLEGPLGQAISGVARRRQIHLVAPLVLAEGTGCYNAMVGFDRHGKPSLTYRKRHPWFPETWATAGTAAAPTIDIEGTRVTIAICFDVQFLEEEAGAALDAADLLLFPSAWVELPDTRADMLAGLARRHRTAIANANWAPGVVGVSGQGGSQIVDHNGARIAYLPVVPDGPSPRVPRIMRADATVELPVRRSGT